MKNQSNPREEAAHALKQASRAAKSGDAAGAERWTKIADRMAGAAARLSAIPEPVDDATKSEELGAELRRRLSRFTAAVQARDAWATQCDLHALHSALAREHNFALPPPLPPCPYDDHALEAIGAGWDVSGRPKTL